MSLFPLPEKYALSANKKKMSLPYVRIGQGEREWRSSETKVYFTFYKMICV